jgi:hypothetical protein
MSLSEVDSTGAMTIPGVGRLTVKRDINFAYGAGKDCMRIAGTIWLRLTPLHCGSTAACVGSLNCVTAIQRSYKTCADEFIDAAY